MCMAFIIGSFSASSKSKVSICQDVEFGNDLCVSESYVNETVKRNGTCYTAPECAIKNGSPAGYCAGGYGVCCVFILEEKKDKHREI